MKIIDTDSQALRNYGNEIPEIVEALSRNCTALTMALDLAGPYIRVGSSATAKLLQVLHMEIEEITRILPSVETTSEVTKKQADILEQIKELIG